MPDGLSTSYLADPASLTAEEQRRRRPGRVFRGVPGGLISVSASGGRCGEDYSDSEDAWSYLTHDQARSRAYRWGEDGIAGISDDNSRCAWLSRCGMSGTRS